MNDMEERKGMILTIGEDNVVREWVRPFAEIEVQTEEDYNKLLRLLDAVGKLNELFREGHKFISSVNGITITSLDDLIEVENEVGVEKGDN